MANTSADSFSLARESDLLVFTALMMLAGFQCGACGFGTRVTSKKWARCKRCGTRMQRRTVKEAGEILKRETGSGSQSQGE